MNAVTFVPGDRVKFKMYPRGIGYGVVAVSTRTQERQADGSWAPALVIESEGKSFPLNVKATTKL
jgi:hypothetical protein